MDIKNLAYKDRSEYLRGFSVIMRKNKSNTNNERIMFSIIGNYFGFSGEFCKESLENLMRNKYLSEEPSLFSNTEVADFFIGDVIKIMDQTKSMSSEAIEWLQHTILVNNSGLNL